MLRPKDSNRDGCVFQASLEVRFQTSRLRNDRYEVHHSNFLIVSQILNGVKSWFLDIFDLSYHRNN